MLLVRVRVVLAAAMLAVVFAWSSLAAGPVRDRLDWRSPRIARAGPLAVAYPQDWHALSRSGNGLSIASFPLSRRWLDSEQKSMPADGVFIWAFTYGHMPAKFAAAFPVRPARLRLDPKTFAYYECGFNLEGYALRFRDHGYTVQVMVALGRHADPNAALEVVNRLGVS
ncbi:MAG TPA: hypothetical protein VE693_07950 [Gaiellaceae bacterium]|nr:hypothetical protein [Gaiellaceae bacterium]